MPSEDSVPENVSVADSPSYQLGTSISGGIRDISSHTLGILLTQVEAAMGDTAQAKAFKQVVKREVYRMQDYQQGLSYNSVDAAVVTEFDPQKLSFYSMGQSIPEPIVEAED